MTSMLGAHICRRVVSLAIMYAGLAACQDTIMCLAEPGASQEGGTVYLSPGDNVILLC